MKIFAISDIHGKTKYLRAALEKIKSADLVVISGDFSGIGEKQGVSEILRDIEEQNSNILAVHGNWDGPGVIDILKDRGYNLHRTGRIFQGLGFFGLGGSNKTPMNTPTEYTEEEIRQFLEEGYDHIKKAEKKILVTHTPPKNSRDRTFLGIRAGSPAIREFLERNFVDLCVCGHIHEAWGTDTVNSCIIANPGSFKSGKYLSINVDEKITVEEGKIKTGFFY